MRALLSALSFTVFAAESLVSPLPADGIVSPLPQAKPLVSFAQLVTADRPQVLGATTEESVLAPTPMLAEPTPTATPTPEPRRTKKSHYIVALLGDSMIDTLGPDVPHLKHKLTAIYPATTFAMRNYGVGATNIDYGLERITHDYTYLGSPVPSLVSQQPDVVVVESFGYNPYSFDTGAMDKHWLALASVIDTLRTNLPGVKIVVAATIAPNASVFGDGAAGLAFDPIAKQEKVTVIKRYLDNTVAFAKSQHLPLADAYHASLDSSGNGKLVYINGGDHIHYSDAGRALFAQKVAEAITSSRLLE